jgi:hypothetical protein
MSLLSKPAVVTSILVFVGTSLAIRKYGDDAARGSKAVSLNGDKQEKAKGR